MEKQKPKPGTIVYNREIRYQKKIGIYGRVLSPQEVREIVRKRDGERGAERVSESFDFQQSEDPNFGTYWVKYEDGTVTSATTVNPWIRLLDPSKEISRLEEKIIRADSIKNKLYQRIARIRKLASNHTYNISELA